MHTYQDFLSRMEVFIKRILSECNVLLKALSLIEKAKEEDAAKREILEQLLSQTEVCLHGVVNEVLSVVKEDLPDVFKTFEERIKRLKQRDYYILVAGMYWQTVINLFRKERDVTLNFSLLFRDRLRTSHSDTK